MPDTTLRFEWKLKGFHLKAAPLTQSDSIAVVMRNVLAHQSMMSNDQNAAATNKLSCRGSGMAKPHFHCAAQHVITKART